MDRCHRRHIGGPNPPTGLGTVPLCGVCAGSTQADEVSYKYIHSNYIRSNTSTPGFYFSTRMLHRATSTQNISLHTRRQSGTLPLTAMYPS